MVGTRILVTGASGLLGRYLMRCSPTNYNLCGTWLHHPLPEGHQMDVRRQGEIDAIFETFQPSVIVHCAAIGSVDYCENHYEEAYDANVRGVRRLLRACKRYKAKFVFLSSNAVFAGTQPPYREYDLRLPINTYGRLKKFAEDEVMEYEYDWLIVRPILLYGVPRTDGRGNWATRVTDALSNGHMLHVVNDVLTQPTYTEDLAQVIWAMVPTEVGVYHVAAPDVMTLYDFAMRVARVWTRSKVNVDNRILPTGSEKFRDMAPRPTNTTYDLDKLRSFCEREKVPMPCGVDEGLQRMYNEL